MLADDFGGWIHASVIDIQTPLTKITVLTSDLQSGSMYTVGGSLELI